MQNNSIQNKITFELSILLIAAKKAFNLAFNDCLYLIKSVYIIRKEIKIPMHSNKTLKTNKYQLIPSHFKFKN